MPDNLLRQPNFAALVALVWLLDSFVALYLTTPRRLRQAVHPEHRPAGVWWQRWRPAWTGGG